MSSPVAARGGRRWRQLPLGRSCNGTAAANLAMPMHLIPLLAASFGSHRRVYINLSRNLGATLLRGLRRGWLLPMGCRRRRGKIEPNDRLLAPYAADRSRREAGRSPPPGPGRNAGPTPAYWGATPAPHSVPQLRSRQLRRVEGAMPSSPAICVNGERCSPAGQPPAAIDDGSGPLDAFPLPSELTRCPPIRGRVSRGPRLQFGFGLLEQIPVMFGVTALAFFAFAQY